MDRTGLIGDTGFIGGVLQTQMKFAATYNSRTIDTIVGERFDTVICAGAPATMWLANTNPDADRSNLERLVCALRGATIDRLVLISTIAVLDDVSAGYSENTARYETNLAYGRHRRALEEFVLDRPGSIVLRLPALFGPGLRKNFIFDLLNPVPSFIKPETFNELCGKLNDSEHDVLDTVFSYDKTFGMHRLDRAALEACGRRPALEWAFVRNGLQARNFTNSSSRFQYYNLANLTHDIEVCLSHGIRLLHVCSQPWGAAELHEELLGSTFLNDAPPLVHEDMRTEFASEFGRQGCYIYDRAQILGDLRNFLAARGSS